MADSPKSRTAPVLVLVGFMGAGKTTVGALAAKLLKREFLDLDVVIEAVERCRVRDIFSRRGEPYFRSCERRELRRLLSERNTPLVLAVGGGAFVDAENQATLSAAGALVVFLDAPVEELRRRLGAGAAERPLARDEEAFAALYFERHRTYEQADATVDTSGKTLDQVAAEVAGIDAAFSKGRVERSTGGSQ